MKREKERFIRGVVLLAMAAAMFLLFRAMTRTEASFCRDVLGGLISGSYSSAKYISWEKFKAVGADIGAQYLRFSNEKDKKDYREVFIRNFSEGFRRAGGSFRSFSNWRIDKKDSEKTVVAADYRGKIILLTVPKYEKKVSEIQWKQ